MRAAYFDCFSGISGDMTLSALVDAGADFPQLQSAIGSLGLGANLAINSTTRNGFRGQLLSIDHPAEHSHRYLRDIHGLIRRSRISSTAKDTAMRIFERLGRAEAKVHGTTIDRVQFHEVGAVDSIVDIVGVAIAWDMLNIDRAYASPIPTGCGQIRIAHGIVSIPAPATAELLTDIPIAPCSIPHELTTPTGAAIIAELVHEFGPLPPMQVGRIGYGAGNRTLDDRPNLLRVLIGDLLPARTQRKDDNEVCVLETNLDDCTGEQIGFAIERLWKAGALDVFSTPIYMKKGRPGTLLTVISKPEDKARMENILFHQTGTLGIRYRRQSRSILPRAAVDVRTPWGVVAGKVSKLPNGQVDFSPEFDDCRRIAAHEGLRLSDVMNEVRECYYAAEFQSETNAIKHQYEEQIESTDEADTEIPVITNEETETDSVGSQAISTANQWTTMDTQTIEDRDLDGDGLVDVISFDTNRLLLQAAVEDGDTSDEPPQSEQIVAPEPAYENNLLTHEMSDSTTSIDVYLNDEFDRSENFYRWDSSPWRAEPPSLDETSAETNTKPFDPF